MVECEPLGQMPSIAELLASTLEKPGFERMVILVPGAGSLQPELYQVWQRRTKFWQQLGPKRSSKVAMYSYRADPESPYLVHSKTWVFDDCFAVIGSANCNRRGYSHDSEVAVGIADPIPENGTLNFAHELRVQLWLKHLNRKGKRVTREDLIEFSAGSALWDDPYTLLERVDLEHPSNQPPDRHLSIGIPTHLKLELPPFGLLLSSSPRLRVALLDWDREWNLIIDPDGS